MKRFSKVLPLLTAGVLLASSTMTASAEEMKSIVPEVIEGHLQHSEYQKSMYEYPDLPAVSTNDLLPEKFDLRDDGDVTSVKDQGIWGSCWSFGFFSAAEGTLLRKYDLEADLSEHHLAWYALQPEIEGSQAGEGQRYTAGRYPLMSGGNEYMSIATLGAWKGAATEEDVPYTDASGAADNPDGNWSVEEGKRYLSSYQLQNVDLLPLSTIQAADGSYVYRPEATEIAKKTLMDTGVLYISYCADQSMPGEAGNATYFNYKTGAQYTYEYQPLNHMVSIVGWDDNFAKENFNQGHQPEGDGAWIVKNSWGTEWGSGLGGFDWDGEGYFYLSYYDRSIASMASISMIPSEWGNDHNYQYDYLGAAANLPITQIEQSANVFTAEGHEALKAVSVFSSVPNMTVKADVYKLGADGKTPSDGEKVATVEKQFAYNGYHMLELDTPVMLEPGEKFAVAVTETAPDGMSYVYLESGMDASHINGFRYDSRINEGESFLLIDGTWQDQINDPAKIAELAGEAMGIAVNPGNVMIKAFTDDVPVAELSALQVSCFDEKDQAIGQPLAISPSDKEIVLPAGTAYVTFQASVSPDGATAQIRLNDRIIQPGEKVLLEDLKGAGITVTTAIDGGAGSTCQFSVNTSAIKEPEEEENPVTPPVQTDDTERPDSPQPDETQTDVKKTAQNVKAAPKTGDGREGMVIVYAAALLAGIGTASVVMGKKRKNR